MITAPNLNANDTLGMDLPSFDKKEKDNITDYLKRDIEKHPFQQKTL